MRVSNVTPVWTWFGGGGLGSSGTSGSSSSSGDVLSGEVAVGGTTYRYRCVDGNLVEMTAH